MGEGSRHLGARVRRALAALGTGLLLTSCATPPFPAAEPAPEPPGEERLLHEALQSINRRRYRRALAQLDQAEIFAPGSAALQGYRARILFRTGRVEEAAAAAALALERDPRLHWVLPTLWVAQLESGGGSLERRTAVGEDIRRRLGTGERPPELLFAAYQGFRSLGERAPRVTLILALGDLVEGSPLEHEVASALFEEALQTRNPVERLPLAEAYVRHFPDGRMAFEATRMLLQASATVRPEADPASLSVLGAGLRHRRVAAGVGSWLVEEGRDPKQAVELLEHSLSLLGTEGDAPLPPHFTETLWAELLRGERALCLLFLGRARRSAGDLGGAREALRSAAAERPDLGDPLYHLGAIALEEGRADEALTHLRRALERSGRRPEAAELLGRALRELHGWAGDPREFFLQEEGGVGFADVTAVAGLDGVAAERVAWCDLNGDGRDDLLFGGSRIFVNRGDGTFVESSERSGVSGYGGASGAACADLDGDGDLDFVATGRSGLRFWRNTGGGRFEDATDTAMVTSGPGQTEAAAWGDLDNDGDLDLYLANYERPGATRGLCVQDQLLRNDGNGGFEEISAEAGILSEEAMCGRGVTWADLDGDGWQDIVVANYRLDPNFLWHNGGDGRFEDVAEAVGARGTEVSGAFGHSIGVAAGDVDGNGSTDLFVANLAHPRYIEFSDRSQLLLGSGPPGQRFTDRYPESGIAFDETSSDPALADVDGDGDLDLYVTSIYPGRYAHLYLNDGRGHFTDRTWLAGTRVANAWGAAFADFDGDGDPDLAVASRDGVRLFRNDTAGATWIGVGLRDRRCNRFGVGAKITVRYGGSTQRREVTAGRGTGSQDSLTLQFGLGSHDGPVDVEALTLCGDRLRARLGSPNRTVTLTNP